MLAAIALWRVLPCAIVVAAGLFVLPQCPWPRPSLGKARRGIESHVPTQSWQSARALLDQASTKRRNGDREGALVLYRCVLAAPSARDTDHERAAYWQARLRIEKREESAIFELENWVHESRDPMLLARTAQLARREAMRTDSKEWASLLNGLYSASVDALTIRSVVHDENGERAKRWLKALSK